MSIQEWLHLPQFQDGQLQSLSRELQRMWLSMAQQVNNGIVPFYAQDAEPTIPDNSIALWQDTDGAPNYYLLGSFGGTQKKVELT